MKTRALPFFVVCLSAHSASASAATALWDGGGTTAGWGQANNWDLNVLPTFNNQLDVTLYKPASPFLTNFIGAGRTIRSLTFNDDADAAVSIRLVDGSNLAQTLTFDADAGSAGINVTAGAAGAITIGDTGKVNLADPLLITHNGTGNLTISQPMDESVSGVTVTKTGTGRAILSGANTYTGATTVNAGILRVSNVNGLGATSGDTFVTAVGTLDINGILVPAGETISIAGTGAGGIGALFSNTGNSGNANYIGDNLVLTADASIGAPSGIRYGIGANGTSTTTGLFKLTKVGLGQFDLRGQVSVGDILVSEGILQTQGNATYNTGYNLTINSGCEFRAFEISNPFARNIVLNGGKFSSTGALPAGDLVTSPITLTGSALIDGAGDATDKATFSGNITESAAGATLAIGGSRRIVLSGANTYTGATTVGAVAGSTVTLQASGTFTTSDISVGATASIDGEGSTTGSLTLAAGSTVRFNPATTGANEFFRAADVVITPGDIINVAASNGVAGTNVVVLHDGNGGLDLGSFSLNNGGRGSLALGGAGGNSDLIYNLTAANLEWRALVDNVWRPEDGVSNFQNLGTNAPDKFFARDNVDFVDAATGNVSVAASILAGNVTFKNTTGNDVFLMPSAAETMDAVAIATTSSGNATVSTPIIGSTAITAGGTGSLTLSGTNTSTGALTVNSGTLILNNSNTIASSLAVNGGTLQIGTGGLAGTIPSLPFTNNGSVVVNRSDAFTLGTVISGSGTLVQAGSGTTTITAEQTYTGLTTVNAGVLQIGTTTTGSIAGDVLVNNATASLDFSRTNNITYAGNITGIGAVAKRGTGNVTLAGTNTFSGGLNLYNGIIFAADAQLGAGPITMGPGLTNQNTLSINGGTVDNDIYFSNGGTGLKIVNIATGFTDATLSGTIHFDANGAAGTPGVSRISTNSGTIVISGKMTGTGTAGYAKRQNGQVIITNPDNDYTGGTNIVDTGVLLVNGKVPGSVYFGEAIDAGGAGIMDGTLGGSGLIGGNVKLQVPSRLSPGGAAAAGVHTDTRATLTINGNLEADLIGTGAGRIVMQLGALAGPNDRINVGGDFKIGAGVLGLTEINVANAGGLQAGVYTLVHAASITGTLDAANVTGEISPGLNGTLSISGTDLILTVAATGNPYTTWASTFPGLTDSSFDVDFDGDGIATGLEWVLGGNPTLNDAASIAPVVTGSAANGITLAFKREEDSIGVATVTVEYGTTLGAWPGSVIIGAASSGPDANGMTVNVNAVPDPDAVTVTIPATNAASGKLFARLKATMP